MLMSETQISLSGTILHIKNQIKCDQIHLKARVYDKFEAK